MSLHERANGQRSSGAAGWSLVVPLKPASAGKSRLASFAGAHRASLVQAMALDTVAAALACPAVADVVVVTGDEGSADELRGLGAIVVPDEPGEGLNPALQHGAAIATTRRPGTAIAAILADLPALRPNELARALDAAREYPTSFVSDADMVGTTLYCAGAASCFTPRFGSQSRAAHLATGAVELAMPGIASVRRDVDTESDLREAVRLGVGPRTRIALAPLGHGLAL